MLDTEKGTALNEQLWFYDHFSLDPEMIPDVKKLFFNDETMFS